MPVIKLMGKPNCPLCDRAKMLLNSRNIEFTYVDVSANQEAFEQLTALSIRSVPAFFLSSHGEDVFMGGYAELSAYVRDSGGSNGA